jgi:hypothetical protein
MIDCFTSSFDPVDRTIINLFFLLCKAPAFLGHFRARANSALCGMNGEKQWSKRIYYLFVLLGNRVSKGSQNELETTAV